MELLLAAAAGFALVTVVNARRNRRLRREYEAELDRHFPAGD